MISTPPKQQQNGYIFYTAERLDRFSVRNSLMAIETPVLFACKRGTLTFVQEMIIL